MDHIHELIGKVIAGEASREDKDFVDSWILEDEANRRYFDQLKTIFEKAASPAIQMQFDSDAAWQKVREKLNAKPTTIPMYRKVGTWNWGGWKIAATILLLICVCAVIYFNTRPAIQIKLFTSGKQMVIDTLPDGSTAFLNSKSEIRYEYNTREKTRTVKLRGEAYFAVRHEEEKPFVIETNDVLIRDIGTSFNVKAFPESQRVEVFVEEGEVQFYSLMDSGLTLSAGEKGVYDKHKKIFSKVVKIDTNSLSYKTKVFSFNNIDLGNIVDKLNDVYGSKIHLANQALRDCHLTVNFNDDTLDTIVDVLAETLNLVVTKRNDEILLDGKGCSN